MDGARHRRAIPEGVKVTDGLRRVPWPFPSRCSNRSQIRSRDAGQRPACRHCCKGVECGERGFALSRGRRRARGFTWPAHRRCRGDSSRSSVGAHWRAGFEQGLSLCRRQEAYSGFCWMRSLRAGPGRLIKRSGCPPLAPNRARRRAQRAGQPRIPGRGRLARNHCSRRPTPSAKRRNGKGAKAAKKLCPVKGVGGTLAPI